MNTTAKRLYAIVVIVLATYGVNCLVQAAVKMPEAVLPDWTFREMPYQLGSWHGEDTEMDPVIAAATGADIIVDRLYRDDAGTAVSIHTAVFKDPSESMIHTPMNCYRAAGWLKIKESWENLQLFDDLTIPVLSVVWERDGERIIVIYWYQLGEHVMFGRWDMGKIRVAMRGKTKWPALIKVMLQISAPDVDDAKSRILALSELVGKWENQPQHRKYFEESPEGATGKTPGEAADKATEETKEEPVEKPTEEATEGAKEETAEKATEETPKE